MWHSGGDEDGLQSQRFGDQIQVSAKKNKKLGGGRSRDRVRDRDRGVNRVRNWDRVRGGGERITLFEKHSLPPTQKKKWKNHLVRRKLTS